jgi:hypothetical protein
MNHLEKVGAMLCNKRLQLGILELQSISRKVIYRAICHAQCMPPARVLNVYVCVQNGMLICVRFYRSVCARMPVRQCKTFI